MPERIVEYQRLEQKAGTGFLVMAPSWQRLYSDAALCLTDLRVKLDRIDQEKASFHRKVRQAFLALARKERKRYAVIDASLPQHEVWAAIEKVMVSKKTSWKPK